MSCGETQPRACLSSNAGNDAVITVNTPTRFASISTVCLTFHFAGDLVDTGEQFGYLAGGGSANFGSTSLSQRTSCLETKTNPPKRPCSWTATRGSLRGCSAAPGGCPGGCDGGGRALTRWKRPGRVALTS